MDLPAQLGPRVAVQYPFGGPCPRKAKTMEENQEQARQPEQSGDLGLKGRLLLLVRRPGFLLAMLAAWTLLAFASQLFVNGGLFLDIHDQELDGALGGLALSFNALPLALVYLFVLPSPAAHPHVFWLALVHQGAMFAAAMYHWALGTFTIESIVIPATVSAILALLSFLQVFEPRKSPEKAV